MDRPLDATFKRNRERRRALVAASSVIGLAAIFGWGTSWLRPSVARAARCDPPGSTGGPIEATITASGTVVPEVERVLSSPVDARVVRILKRPGAPSPRAIPSSELDLQAARVAADKLARDVAVKENQRTQARLALEKSLNDLEGREQIKRLQLESNRAQLSRTDSSMRPACSRSRPTADGADRGAIRDRAPAARNRGPERPRVNKRHS